MFRFNLETEIKVSNRLQTGDTLVFAYNGELFASVALAEQLNEDSEAGET
jgi:hypothetical protein